MSERQYIIRKATGHAGEARDKIERLERELAEARTQLRQCRNDLCGFAYDPYVAARIIELDAFLTREVPR